MSKKKLSEEDVRKLLDEGIPWPRELQVDKVYARLHDDHDGTEVGEIAMGFSPDGDVWITIRGDIGSFLRFRTPFGGGGSPRVRNALVLLALAIHFDNESESHHRGS